LIHSFKLEIPKIDFRYFYNYESSEYENFSKNSDFRLLPNHIAEAYNEPNLLGTNSHLIEGQIDKYGNHAYLWFSEDNTWKNGVDQGSNKKKNYYSEYLKEIEQSFIEPQVLNKYRNVFLSGFKSVLMNNTAWVPNYFHLFIEPEEQTENTLYNALKKNQNLTEVFLFIKRNDHTIVNFDLEGEELPLKTWDFDFTANQLEQEDELVLEKRAYRGYLEERIQKAIGGTQLDSYEDVIDGNKTTISPNNFNLQDLTNLTVNSETIGYKIDKITRNSVVQTYYVDRNLMDLNDNHYIFDQQYIYRISKIMIVYGISASAGGGLFSFEVSTKIIEVPIKEIDFRAIVWPIDAPFVKPYTKSNENHRIDFLIEDREGNFVSEDNMSEMIAVVDSDYNYINKVVKSQFYENGKVKFSSRAATGQYQVFKLDYKPKSYNDFANGGLGTIGINDGKQSANFTDHIAYNKKHYYAFRSVNHNNEPGNLSPILEIELLKDADENILINKEFHFNQEEDFDPSHDFRKFIRIVPDLDHTSFVDELEIPQNQNDVVLGVKSDEKLWEFKDNKKFFKLRFTNKSSGQKFDINLRFINKQTN